MKLSIALIIFAACGGSPKPASTGPATAHEGPEGHGHEGHEGPEDKEHGEMANLSPELVKFHAVLGPKWHAAPGPERMTGACTAIADFTAGADAVAKAPAPAKSHTAMWAQETKELVDAVAGMKAKCSARDTASFEAAFASVHAGFHKLLEAASGEGEHGEEKHEGGGY